MIRAPIVTASNELPGLSPSSSVPPGPALPAIVSVYNTYVRTQAAARLTGTEPLNGWIAVGFFLFLGIGFPGVDGEFERRAQPFTARDMDQVLKRRQITEASDPASTGEPLDLGHPLLCTHSPSSSGSSSLIVPVAVISRF